MEDGEWGHSNIRFMDAQPTVPERSRPLRGSEMPRTGTDGTKRRWLLISTNLGAPVRASLGVYMSKCMLRNGFLMTVLSVGSTLAAQESPYLGAMKIGIGSLSGDAQKVLDSGGTFSFSVEAAYPLKDRAALVGSLGFRQYSGGNRLLSFIPVSVTATGVNPTIYETRNRRTEASGLEFSGLFRFEILPKEFYVQGGLRLSSAKAAETDTGTQLVTNGNAIANTGTLSNANILAVNTIASKAEKKALGVGLVAGAGYRFLNRYAVELNLFTTKLETPSAGSKNGLAGEVSFSFQF